MNDNNKWIKLHSKMLNWEWYTNANVMRLFIHCLLKANWKEGRFQGKIIPRGSFVTSLEKLSKELGLSVQQIRTALNHLISTKEIANESLSQFRIITVVNYDLYQENNKAPNNQLTSNQQTNNNQITTIVEYKTNRIIDDIEISSNGSNTHACENLNLFQFIEKAFARTFSEFEYQRINSWKDDELTRYAIEITMLRGKNDLSFVEGVLRKFKTNNITTLEQAKIFEEEYQKSKMKKNNQKGNEESYTQRRIREEREKENDQNGMLRDTK